MFVTTKYLDSALNRVVDDLGRMIKAGFDGVDDRFNHVENRLQRMERQQHQMVYRFEHDDLDRRVRRIESKIGLTK